MPSGCNSNCTGMQKSQYLHASSLPSGVSRANCSACAHVRREQGQVSVFPVLHSSTATLRPSPTKLGLVSGAEGC